MGTSPEKSLLEFWNGLRRLSSVISRGRVESLGDFCGSAVFTIGRETLAE